ncbi:MAG: thiamine phosphate synthase [Gemmatimonadetes bacterium]|nr:thiamine phosphate synthase [Gemmatimonadota bacterium]
MTNKPFSDLLRLVVITDPDLSEPLGLINIIHEVLEAGVGMIQLRDKTAGAKKLLGLAESILPLTRSASALLIVNDRLDVALAAHADGVHLGPDDLNIAPVRNIVPENFIIGYSTDDPLQGKMAESQGANYIGCGTVYQTSSKSDAGNPIGTHGVKKMVDAVNIPVIGIGGIIPGNATGILEAGASGVATIGAIMGSSDPRSTTKEFLRVLSDSST